MFYFKPDYFSISFYFGMLVFCILAPYFYPIIVPNFYDAPAVLVKELVVLLNDLITLFEKRVDGGTLAPVIGWFVFSNVCVYGIYRNTMVLINSFYAEIDIDEHDFLRHKQLKWVL